MTPIDMLLSRASAPDLDEPGPDAAELDLILQAAMRAPDHGKLRPWRFVLIRGEARARWADVISEATLSREPEIPAEKVERHRRRALQTPLIIGLGARLQHGHKIPEIEQMLAVGAAAMNMLNAVHALGYGGVWLTGGTAYDQRIVTAVGLEPGDKLAGFLFVGTRRAAAPPPRRPDPAAFTIEWQDATLPEVLTSAP